MSKDATTTKQTDQSDFKDEQVSRKTTTSESESDHTQTGSSGPDKSDYEENKDNSGDAENQSNLLEFEIGPDGHPKLKFEVRQEYDILYQLGNIGMWVMILGILTTIISPLLFFNGLITLPVLLAVVNIPLAVGSALVLIAKSPEYFPWAKK